MDELLIINNVNPVLTDVLGIIAKYRESDKITGNNYNIFSSLKLESKEAVHSNFIADLLNPMGAHGMGNLFFDLFLKMVIHKSIDQPESIQDSFMKKIKDFNISGYRVTTEHPFSNGGPQEMERGRLDIFLQNINNSIIIENKIHAKDGYKQLIKYHNQYGTAAIIYLSLYGYPPDQTSDAGLVPAKDYICISYKDDITAWLEKCQKETADYPLVRETLTQYINTIKDLTGQSKNNKMKIEIKNILLQSEQNIEAGNKIKEVLDLLQKNANNNVIAVFDIIYEDRPNGYMLFHELDTKQQTIYLCVDKTMSNTNIYFTLFIDESFEWEAYIEPDTNFADLNNRIKDEINEQGYRVDSEPKKVAESAKKWIGEFIKIMNNIVLSPNQQLL